MLKKHLKSNNIKFTSNNDANEVVDELYEPLGSRYQNNLETLMRGSDFNFDSVQLMYYKCNKVNFRRSSSYIDFPYWIKKKKATINPKNKDKKCFQDVLTVALHYEEIESYPERVSKFKPFINKYNWERISYSSKIDDWKSFEKNIRANALNILYINKKEIYPAYISKINSNCDKINNSLNDSKRRKRRLALPCRKETFYIMNSNNIKTPG